MAPPTRSLGPVRNPSDYMGLQSVPTVTILQPEKPKSWIRSIQGMYESPAEERITAAEQVLATIQATLTGGLLGLVDAYNDGLDVKGIPVDLVGGSVLGVAAVLYDSRATARAADSCNTVYGFRKVKSVIALLGAKMIGGSANQNEVSSVAGEVSEKREMPPGKDPIVALGESL